MRLSVARLFVSVALIAAAAPALASTTADLNRREESKSALYTATNPNIRNGYWSASSEYYVTKRGYAASNTSGRPVRRVLITGYHPVKGFEGEIAKERTASASAQTVSTPAQN